MTNYTIQDVFKNVMIAVCTENCVPSPGCKVVSNKVITLMVDLWSKQ